MLDMVFWPQALNKLLQVVRTDLDRERESRVSLEESSHTADLRKNQTLADKLHHVSGIVELLQHVFTLWMGTLCRQTVEIFLFHGESCPQKTPQ